MQLKDFGKFPGKQNLNPDKIGGATGIRQIPAQNARPDDVSLRQNYRLAMHKLHNVVMVLENADRSNENVQSPNTEKLRATMVAIQKKGKDLAKTYKASMRDLSSNSKQADLQVAYENGMDALIVELTNHTREGEGVIKKNGYVGKIILLRKRAQTFGEPDG